jgi:hypothetical protein
MSRGTKRPPAEPGNDLALKHGAYATLAPEPRVAELVDSFRDIVPGHRPADEIALRLLCLAVAPIERSSAALDDASPDELKRLREDERGWANTARRLLNDLGMTPRALVESYG